MPISFNSGISKHSGISGNEGITAHPGLTEGGDQINLIWHFDATNFASLTIVGDEVTEWVNLSNSPEKGSNLTGSLGSTLLYSPSVQNALPGVYNQISGIGHSLTTLLKNIPQPFTILIAFQSTLTPDDSAVLRDLTNPLNISFARKSGSTYRVNWPTELSINVDTTKEFAVGSLEANGATSTFTVGNGEISSSLLADIGVDDLTGIQLIEEDASNSAQMAISEIKIWDGTLDPVVLNNERAQLFTKYADTFPWSLTNFVSTGRWYDASHFMSIKAGVTGVVRWEDRHTIAGFIEAVLPEQPIYLIQERNGRNVIQSDGDKDMSGNFSTALNPFTFWFVVKIDDLLGGPKRLWQSVNPFAPFEDLNFWVEYDLSGNINITADDGVNFITVPSSTDYMTIVIQVNGASSKVWRNDDAPVIGNLPISTTITRIRLGSQAGDIETFAWKLCEFGYISNSVNSEPEVDSLIAYLKTKWDIQEPVTPDLYANYDASDESTVTIFQNSIFMSSWANKSSDIIAISDLGDSPDQEPVYFTNFQNGLPAAFLSAGAAPVKLVSSGTVDQAFTYFVAFRNWTWVDDGKISSDAVGAILGENLTNQGLKSNLGTDIDITSLDFGDWRIESVYAVVANGASSKTFLKNAVFDLQQAGDLGLAGLTSFNLGANAGSSIFGGVMEIKIVDGALSDVDVATEIDLLRSKWFSQYPATICEVWGDPSSRADTSLGTGNKIVGIIDRIPTGEDGSAFTLIVNDQPTKGTINGLPAMQFNGVLETIGTTLSISGNMVLFFVINMPLPATDTYMFGSEEGHELFVDVSVPAFVYFTPDGSIQVPFSSDPTTLIIEINGASSNIYKNDDAPVSGTLGGAELLDPTLGSLAFGDQSYCKMGEWGIASGTLTAQEISDLVDHLAKWRVPGALSDPVWWFDSENEGSLTLTGDEVTEWKNLTVGTSVAPALTGTLTSTLKRFPSVQNGLPGIGNEDTGDFDMTSLFSLPQPFTAIISHNFGPNQNGASPIRDTTDPTNNRLAEYNNSDSTTSAMGTSITFNFDENTRARTSTIVADGVNSTYSVDSGFGEVSSTGDLGSDGLDGLRLMESIGASTTTIGSIMEIKIWDKVLNAADIANEKFQMNERWLDTLPSVLSPIGWFDASFYFNVLRSGTTITDIYGRASGQRLSQFVLSNAPTYLIQDRNNRNVANFDGTEWMDMPFGTTTNSWTFVLVWQPDALPANSGVIVDSFDGLFSVTTDLIAEPDEWVITDDGGTNEVRIPFVAGWNVIIVTNEGGTTEVFQNQLPVVNGTLAGNTINRLSVGGIFGFSGDTIMKYGEMMTFDYKFSAANLDDLQKYLFAKWDIT